MTFYYTVKSSHWTKDLEFKSEIEMKPGQYFRILSHSSNRHYPTRFKVLDVHYLPRYTESMVEIFDVDFDVDPFDE